jgi:hypothetical protein
MPTLQIHDMLTDHGVLAVDLRHVLAALKQRAANAGWEIGAVTAFEEDLWAIGDEDAVLKLGAMATSGERVPGQILKALANKISQVIWGEFRAFDHAKLTPWVIIRAIDSSFYEVQSEDLDVIKSIWSAFTDVRIQKPNAEP